MIEKVSVCYSLDPLLKTMTPFLEDLTGFNIEDWGSSSNNLAVTDNEKDFALFEYEYNKVYFGHIFCRDRRGKEAIEFSKKALDFVFTSYAEVINGLVPLEKRNVVIMMRKLGFKSYGVIDTEAGLMTHLILTKKEWRELHG